MKNIFVGLSGGVDSSVSAALLKREGYNVTGVYMKNWTQDVGGVECPWKQDLADARAVAAKLDIPFMVFDFQEQYRSKVVDMMVAEYQAGRTPNPDVMCNQEIKFKLFLDAAILNGADGIATGHYARAQNGRMYTASDDNKDQTYFLYRVTADALTKTIFPLANLTKPQVRELSLEFDLPTAKKPDSQGICFVGEVGVKSFLQQYVRTYPGDIVLVSNGSVLGQHDGAALYTIGQRQGLGIGGGKPYYVTSKDMDKNIVYVTDDSSDTVLERSEFDITNTHWINDEPKAGLGYGIRLRHRGEIIPGSITYQKASWHIKLEHSARAVTAGQSAVIYLDTLVIGGGIISV